MTIWNGDYPWIIGGVDHLISKKQSYVEASKGSNKVGKAT